MKYPKEIDTIIKKELKELLEYITITLEKQKVEINDKNAIDIFGFYEDKGYSRCVRQIYR